MSTFKDLLPKGFQAQLKQLGKSSATHTDSPTITDKKQTISPLDDKTLFMQAMSGVTPLKHEKSVISRPTKDTNAPYRRANAQGTDDDNLATLSDMQALLNPVAGDAFLSHKSPTLQNKLFEQLKQGKLRWYDAVDLHGADIDEAREAVLALIAHAKKNNETVVKIVHGKGMDAVIKTCVNGWLRQLPDVLAFVSAPANDGGNGAVLVLIKRQKFA